MFLKPDADLEAFFARVRECKHEVIFCSTEHDLLSLKSRLCLFLFTAASLRDGPPLQGDILCESAEDEELLAEFLE